MKITARTRYVDFKNNFSLRQLYAVIGYVLILSIVSVLFFAFVRDWLLSITLLAAAIAGYFIFTQSAHDFEVETMDLGIRIGEFELPYVDIESWALIDLGDTIEVVLKSKRISQPFIYFYLSDKDSSTPLFIKDLQQLVPYDEEMPGTNPVHRVMRYFGLR